MVAWCVHAETRTAKLSVNHIGQAEIRMHADATTLGHMTGTLQFSTYRYFKVSIHFEIAREFDSCLLNGSMLGPDSESTNNRYMIQHGFGLTQSLQS